jgi:DNA-binding transcriptional LysR family regulator
MLERHELETFLTLAEELHFGRTAERLHVSTARVSRTIRKVERRTGVPLFSRTSRRVELTAVGRQLYDEMRPAWAQLTMAFGRAVDAGRGVTGLLRAAFTGAAGGQLLVGAGELFRTRLPGCAVEIREAQLGDVLPWLRDGHADIALAGFPVHQPGIVTGPPLVREARMLAVPSGHPFARRQGTRGSAPHHRPRQRHPLHSGPPAPVHPRTRRPDARSQRSAGRGVLAGRPAAAHGSRSPRRENRRDLRRAQPGQAHPPRPPVGWPGMRASPWRPCAAPPSWSRCQPEMCCAAVGLFIPSG